MKFKCKWLVLSSLLCMHQHQQAWPQRNSKYQHQQTWPQRNSKYLHQLVQNKRLKHYFTSVFFRHCCYFLFYFLTTSIFFQKQICFPSLQSFVGCGENSSGHYFLVNLNLKAETFEVMDSITTKNGESVMMDAWHLLVAAIKVMWSKEYVQTNFDISELPMVVIPLPKQTNG